ncbi:MAG: glycoside hydrolase [Acidobacteriota bacterium]|nr:glycoside hydrolase [Acidobacteriota bacterium]
MPDLHWRLVGPFRGGRTRAAAGVPGQPNVFYMGQVDGGVWKSDDYGRTWNPIFDNEPSQSVGAIAVAPSDSNIVYVASGEGLHRPDLSVGNGVYRSNDAGKTWQHLGLRDGQQIPSLVVDPRNPNRLFAAVLGHPYGPNAERGIYRSADGGQTWQQVLYKDPNTGGSDVVIDPLHPDVVYAALWQSRLGPWEDGNQYDGTGGGLFKSTDGGNTWRQLTQGLPGDLVQIQVAIAASDPNRLYATLSTTHEGGYATGTGLGVYRSDDAGESWYKATDDPRPAMKIGGGDLPILAVDPKNPDVVYSASIVTTRSTDGGKTWTSLRGAPGGDDYQNLWINPLNPDIILLVSDQGAVVSVNRGRTWSSWYNQPTAQLYHVAVTNTFPYQLCAGQQESGSVCISSRGNDGEITFRDWHPAGIIEYGYAAPDPLHPEIVYGAGRTEVSRYNRITGQVQNVTPLPAHNPAYRADRTEPILFSPADPHLLFYAANVLFETRDYGRSWQAISPDLSREHTGQPASLASLSEKEAARRRGVIYSVAASFLNTDTLWAGTDDGLVWVTRDHGRNWKNITPAKLTPWSKISQISASHFDDNTAYVSVSGFRIDDLHPHIYRTHDAGATWQSITAGLPDDSPVNTVREDPVRKGLLFAGTETAVWMSTDDGDHWQSLQYNLPHTSMRDLAIQGNDLIVATHGRSFWILDDISPLRQLGDLTAGMSPVLFKPGEAYRVRRSTNTDTPLPPDEPAGQNPPDGAVIDYALPPSVQGAVTLEILDNRNNVVRRYASTDAPESTPEELARQLIPVYWLRMPKTLPAGPGMHRWVWDLRYAAPTATQYEYPISAVPHDTPRTPQGPLALPGTYHVRLTANGKTLTAALTVTKDPRGQASATDLESLFNLEYKLYGIVSISAEAALQAHSIREQIERLSKSASPEVKQALEKRDAEFAALLRGKAASSNAEEDPGLDEVAGEVASLYAQISQADAAPTAAQQKAADEIGREFTEIEHQWERLKSAAIPELNRKLSAAHLPAIHPEQMPETMPQSGDED